MEIEAKYAILGPLNPATLTSLDLGHYHLYPEDESRHQDTLLDTASRAVTSGGHTLRLRRREGRVLLTYKGPNQSSNGIHEREEVEVEVSELAGSDYHQWPSEVRERVDVLIGEGPLIPLVRLYIHRHRWTLERGDRTIGEMVLDQGIISAGGRTARVHELEVELKGKGGRADLHELGDLLVSRLPLQPQPRGKLQRGLVLLDKDHTLDGHIPLYTVGLHVVRRQVRRIRQHLPGVLANIDPEDTHDMRAAVRRLRTALRVLEDSPVFRQKTVRVLRRRLRGLAQGLGAVRDADVLLARIQSDISARPDLEAGLDVLRRRVRNKQRQAHIQLVKRLRGSELTDLLARLDKFVERQPHPASARQRRIAVRHFAGSAIWKRYETVLSYEDMVQDATPAIYHRLRIDCKRLRYTLEVFESELGKGTLPLLKLLTKVQDHLGALQDTVVALDEVEGILRKHPDTAGLGDYAPLLRQERDRLLLEFPALWSTLSDAGVSQELAELIAGL